MKHLTSVLVAALTGLSLDVTHLRAADDGNSVVVVYNSRLPASKEVAEHYAQARNVPAKQVVGFDLSEGEGMSRSEFRFQLQEPLFKKFREEGWFKTKLDSSSGKLAYKVVEASVRYLVLCHGVPVRIQPEPTLLEAGTEKQPAPLRRNEAAVDSELVWLPIFELRPLISGPMANEFYRQTNAAALHPTNGILMTARLDGPTPEIAKGLVDKALAAEATGLWGRTYFDLRGITEGEYKQGDDWIRSGAEIARQLGLPIVVDVRPATFSTNFPMSQIAFYAGWYDEHASGPFAAKTVDFMPGAFAYHLHSFSAATVRSTTQNWVGPLLQKGATATIGCVYEPYLGGTLDVGVFTARFVHEGFSFGEAAWVASPVLSWQTTVIGDPLYRPFALNPQRLHERLAHEKSPLIEWSHLRVVDLNLVTGGRDTELVGYLEEIPETANSAVLSEKLGDLYGAIGKPNSAVLMYRRALTKATSRPQRARLSLALADKLIAGEKRAEAWETLEAFGQEFPEYQNQIERYRQMLDVAQQLKKESDAKQLQEKIEALETPPAAPVK